ncbi:MAG: hypothetical protein IJU91_10825 [Selenomonadaceae bacterium]|nr:hypothetical protein [Selenomonadaceae bacterium]
MTKYTLTKNYSEIAETYGVMQNLSSDANIEVTDSTDDAGIVLKPFQTLNFYQKLYARKIGNTGTCSLAVLPFQDAEDEKSTAADESSSDDESETILDEYGDLFLHEPHKPKMTPLAVKELPHHYLVSISKESLKGQNKFLIQFDDKE